MKKIQVSAYEGKCAFFFFFFYHDECITVHPVSSVGKTGVIVITINYISKIK